MSDHLDNLVLQNLFDEGYKLFNVHVSTDTYVPVLAKNEKEAEAIVDDEMDEVLSIAKPVITSSEAVKGNNFDVPDVYLTDELLKVIGVDDLPDSAVLMLPEWLKYRKQHPTQAMLEAAGQVNFLTDGDTDREVSNG